MARGGRIRHVISYFLARVFEGGGARGIAHAGALKPVAGRGCSVHADAGSSAGSVSAALITARLQPCDIEAHTVTSLSA
jgi:predicted acylesterase/phospholipase RssA